MLVMNLEGEVLRALEFRNYEIFLSYWMVF